ncbi:hypothetical protein KAR91_41215 [Candidatus Pacearchaeota archaeon]|nr:hypothetical protein [Candidatus Pacearchaeota archaeon]
MPDVAIGKNKILFAKAETTFGTPEYPVGTDVLLLTGDGSFKQPRFKAEDLQARPTLSRLPGTPGPYEVGEYSFPCYVKPSGALGTAPKGGQFLKALWGIETIVGATSVTYSLGAIDDDFDSLTIVYKHGHIVYFVFGAIVNGGEFPIEAGLADSAIGASVFSGQFLRMVYAGVDYVNDAAGVIITDTTVEVDDDTKYMVDAKIEFQKADGTWENNSDAGYKITDINRTTHILTFEPAMVSAILDDAEIRGHVPAATDAGVKVHGRYGMATEDIASAGYNDIVIAKSMTSISNNFKILNEEKTNTGYPISAVKASNREIKINIEEVVKKGYGKYIYHSNEATVFGIKLPVGATAGERYRIEAAQVEYATPDLSGAEEITGTREGDAYGTSSYDDEATMVFD